MTQYGPTPMDMQDTQENTEEAPRTIQVAFGAHYAVCRVCIKRVKVGSDGPSLDELRCECGARLHAYEVPAELGAPARGVLPRLIRFWLAGREDGYWDEKRFFRPAAAERAGVAPRQVRFAYQAGQRAGERLRDGAHLHALRVMKMKGAAAASATAGAAPLRAAA